MEATNTLEADPAEVSGWLALPSHADPSRVFYYHPQSRASRWDPPLGSAEELAPLSIKARHVLVKFEGVRDPKLKGRVGGVATRTRAEAEKRAWELRDRIVRGGEKFEDVASAESDCSSYQHGGHLGKAFTRTTMTPAFSNAAFALAVNEMSGPVVSPSGIHIIQRLE